MMTDEDPMEVEVNSLFSPLSLVHSLPNIEHSLSPSKATQAETTAFFSITQFCNNIKRKNPEGTEGIPAMQKDGAELHLQKVHKTGSTVDGCAAGNARNDIEENNCLEETSCNIADFDKTAKLRLFDICSTNKWNCPKYELCEVMGSDQNVMFKYKVTVLINTYSMTELECFSAPKCQREAAQEHAAEGALWYLSHLGYCS